MDGYEAAEAIEREIPDLLRKLQKSHDTFQEDWEDAWIHYGKAMEQLLVLKEKLDAMKIKYNIPPEPWLWNGPRNPVEHLEWEIIGRPPEAEWIKHKWRTSE